MLAYKALICGVFGLKYLHPLPHPPAFSPNSWIRVNQLTIYDKWRVDKKHTLG